MFRYAKMIFGKWQNIVSVVLIVPPIMSILKNGIWETVEGIPARIIEIYELTRQSMVELLSYTFVSIGQLLSKISPVLADFIVIYGIFFASWMISSSIHYQIDKRAYNEDKDKFEKQIRDAAVFHNLDEEKNGPK